MSVPDSIPAPPPADSVSRVARLTLKELRETLRDRRTIVTLILMPLLVYPLLSLAFKQFALSNLHSARKEWKIASLSEEDSNALETLLAQGDRLLGESRPPTAPATSAKRGPGSGPDIESADGPELSKNVTFHTYSGPSIEDSIRASEVDLAVRLRPRIESPPGPGQSAVAPFDFELIYRPDSTFGPLLAEFVERRLQAVNQRYLQARLRQLGDPGEAPLQLRRAPTAEAGRESVHLATLVPMILILMTITGAVYPAIDLTAGERERGTLESLMAAPVPRLALLFAKYLAVLAVAVLTALVNIVGMILTVLSTPGLWQLVFGEHGLTLGAVVLVFGLLVLFAAFFSAVLLCVTSFARSFKEAQAYLIPLMLVSMAPGFLSMMPGIELNAWLSVAPLANIVLLARDVLAGQAPPLWGFVAVATTCLYAVAALALAARIFGSDSILYGSQNSWSDLLRRPATPLPQATLGGALACLAFIVPLYVVFSGMLAQLAGRSMSTQLIASAAMLIGLFAAVPLGVARWQGVELRSGFQIRGAPALGFIGALALGCALAPLAMELILLSVQWGIATLNESQFAEKSPLVGRLVEQWRQISPALVLFAVALTPAVCEELFFRGYLLGAMRGRMPGWLAIAFTALIFGLFHAGVGGVIAVERILSSLSLGLVLGWVCWTTRSVLPGMILHAVVNAFVVLLAFQGEQFKEWGWDLVDQRHIPAPWLAAAAGLAAIGATLVHFSRPASIAPPLSVSPLAAETPLR